MGIQLSKLLRRYRTRHHLLQKQLSAELCISREHYARIEEGCSLPSFHLVKRIAKQLNQGLVILVGPGDTFKIFLGRQGNGKSESSDQIISRRGNTKKNNRRKVTK